MLFVTTVIIFSLYTLILVAILHASNNYEKIKSKYTLSLENLKSYEDMLNQYRVSNHENKNQLLLIRNMLKDKKTKEYIDELIDNKEKDDSNVYNKIKRIASPGIRAVIYSKVLLMNNKKLKYVINIDRKLNSKDFALIPDNLTLDICNILSVFIDNAIDEVSSTKNNELLIEFNDFESEIEITVSNLCDPNLDLNKIYDMGYSAKGGEHGYGLNLVKETVDKNGRYLRNEVEKINNVFTQYLYIKKDVTK